jgi:hypothetical protein
MLFRRTVAAIYILNMWRREGVVMSKEENKEALVGTTLHCLMAELESSLKHGLRRLIGLSQKYSHVISAANLVEALIRRGSSQPLLAIEIKGCST